MNKRSKRRFYLWRATATPVPTQAVSKSFLLFFFTKEALAYGELTLTRLVWIGFAATFFITATAHAARLPARQPGMWQSSTVVTLPDGSKAQGGEPVVTVTCVDALDDQKFFLIKGSACSSLNVSGQGTQYRIDGTCAHAGKPVTVHETLSYVDAQTVQLAGTVTTASGAYTLSAALTFAGACLAGMKPGDEGSVDVNGNFAKTDNINDFDNQ
jgi:hypothetical protein